MTAISLTGVEQLDTLSNKNKEGDHTQLKGYKTAPNQVENQLTTTQQIQKLLKSRQFQDTLAKIVAPQVTNLIEPTVKKINQIEEQVGVLHDYVQSTNQWQQQQSNRQNSMQRDLNMMTTGMQQVQDSMTKLMQMQVDRDGMGGTKRPASTTTSPTNTLKSPQRRQKVQNRPDLDPLITQDNDDDYETQHNSEMDHSPTQSNKPSPTTANAKEQERAEEGGGQ